MQNNTNIVQFLFNLSKWLISNIDNVAFTPTIDYDVFWYFADRASQYIYLNINQLDALNFIMSLFHACIVQFWPRNM